MTSILSDLWYRDYTARYRKTRDQIGALRQSSPFNAESREPANQERLLGDVEAVNRSDRSVSIFNEVLPPEWVDLVEAIERDVEGNRKNIAKLQKLHEKRLEVSFEEGADSARDREIEALTRNISQNFSRCEKKLKLIAGDPKRKLTETDVKMRINVMRRLGQDLQDLSRAFRAHQRDFYEGIKSRDQGLGNTGTGREIMSIDPEQLSSENKHALQTLQSNAAERYQQIVQVAQSIQQLSELFNELNMLVIEQGTILDRIDYNIDSALQNAQKGKAQLRDAYKRQGTKLIFCILLELLTVIVLVGILIYRQTKKSSSS